MQRTIGTTALTVGALFASLGLPAGTAHADTVTPRIDLRVLIVSDGGPATDAVAAELAAAGTPYTEVDLRQSGRPVIDAGFLADTVDGVPHAKYRAVVLPNDNPFAANSTEMAALAAYVQTYAIPQVDASMYARPQTGLQYPADGGYNPRMKDIGVELRRRAARKAAFDVGEVSGWTAPARTPLTLGLPSSTAGLASTVDVTRQSATSSTPRTRVPAGANEQVPYTPDN